MGSGGRRVALLGAAGVACVLVSASCGRSGVLLPGDGGDRQYFGSGRDGALIASGDVEPNTCRILQNVAGDSAAVSSLAGFTSGGLVLLWQVQAPVGLAIGDTASQLAVTTAGTWELVRVLAVSATGSSLQLDRAPEFAYRTGGDFTAQACSVPEYSDVTIEAGARVGTPWSGSVGGIAAFLVSGTLTVETGGFLGVAAGGFEGGQANNGNGLSSITAEVTANEDGGGAKGEGIDPSSFGLYGRGHLANGAGGGNGYNAGGGGGAGAGRGGSGGREWSEVADTPGTEGRPGVPLPGPVTSYLFLGGGGGAGHGDNDQMTSGGNGGGVVFVLARRIDGKGAVDASGEVAGTSGADGSGGGGAGGTVLLVTSSGSFSGLILARGGTGGSSTWAGTGWVGCGGGGGGGRIALGGELPLALVSTSGGRAGVHTSDGVTSWYAQPGTPGVIEAVGIVPVPDPLEP